MPNFAQISPIIHAARWLGVPCCQENRGGGRGEEGDWHGVKASVETETKETTMV